MCDRHVRASDAHVAFTCSTRSTQLQFGSSTVYSVWVLRLLNTSVHFIALRDWLGFYCLDTMRRIGDGPWQPWEDWVQFKSQLARWRPTEAGRNFCSVDSGLPSLFLVSNTSLIFNSFGIHALSGMLRYTFFFSVFLVCGCHAFVRELDDRWAWAKFFSFWYISLSFVDLFENIFSGIPYDLLSGVECSCFSLMRFRKSLCPFLVTSDMILPYWQNYIRILT